MDAIWKDKIYSAVTSGMDFSISNGGIQIYRGKATAYPDGTIEIPVSKICSKYLDSSLPDFRNIADSAVSQPNACKEFSLNQVSGSSSTAIAAYTFYDDWSYEDNASQNRTLSEPINGHMDSRMKLFYTALKNNSGYICYTTE